VTDFAGERERESERERERERGRERKRERERERERERKNERERDGVHFKTLDILCAACSTSHGACSMFHHITSNQDVSTLCSKPFHQLHSPCAKILVWGGCD